MLAYSDPQAERRPVAGVLEDYAFVANACLDAYESTADLSYFNFARRIADDMIERFFDSVSGGFFDTATTDQTKLGVLGTRRKPFQDSPTPAGNPVAAIALLRLYEYTNQADYREKAEQTLEVFAGAAGQYGLFAATYGIAGVLLSEPHEQMVVVGSGDLAEQMYAVSISAFSATRTVIKLQPNEAVSQNLPPTLSQTIPRLPAVKEGKTVAVICSGFACEAPIDDPQQLIARLRRAS